MSGAHGVLTVTCPDRPGIVAAIAGFLADRDANIVEAQQHSESTTSRFFLRVEFEPRSASRSALATEFVPIAERFAMDWRLTFTDRPKRLGILVSKHDHCLVDLLWRQRAGELPVEIPIIISNHPDAQAIAAQFGVPFHHVPITAATKAEQERRQLDLLATHGVDFVAMARYMQILSPIFLSQYPMQVINVHHGLLPSFAGARPYDQARERGVKVIGATAHYATDVLDDGPIIAQQVIAVSHRETVADLVRKGRDAERLVLAAAVRAHAQDRVLLDGRRTIVFD
ncbi:MAG: formyltetrahydrofolate deformylase [Dehalococcoidia bacterium]|nr:formyltetrahydrofolate deformylase [Dehalococcoidia bacterium]